MALGAVVGSIRAVAMATIPRLVAQGLGANAIINVWKPLDLTYRRITMLADIRKISGLAKLEKQVRKVAPNKLFPQYAMVESKFRAARRYFIHARMMVTDEETGETVERWVSFFSNQRMTKDQWTEGFLAGYVSAMYGVGMSIESVELASVEHQRGWNY